MKQYRIREKLMGKGGPRPFRLRLKPQKPGRSWTPEQQKAIGTKGGSILVAAAAGSGKTAVLVERVIQKLTDPTKPVPADRFLVVTFTNMAAGEMRSRITARLREMIAKEPESAFLERQLLLLSKARICTMDAFFGSIVRENFEQLGVSPSLRVADAPELAALRAGAMNLMLERHFENPDEDFLACAAYFGETGEERMAKEALALYEKTRSLPNPREWLANQAARYEETDNPAASDWGRELLKRAGQALHSGASICSQIEVLLQEDDGLQKGYGAAIQADGQLLREGAGLADAGNWDTLRAFLNTASFGPIGRAPKGADAGRKARVTGMRDLCKAALGEAKDCVLCTSSEALHDFACLAPVVRGLFSLVNDFEEEYAKAKAQENLADFSDFAYLTLRLTTSEDGSPTPFAQALAEEFEEILLDEYQDTNRLQDQIFRSVSKDGQNLFYVGDLKQSIYRFRSADPAVFKEKQLEYGGSEDSFPLLLRLSKNFRSRKGVLDSVNSVFSQIMSGDTGGVWYNAPDGGERVHPGAAYPFRDRGSLMVQLIDLKDSGEDETRLVAEAARTARMIASMLREGYPVTEKGALRPCRGGDFAILLRSVRGVDSIYFDALREIGVEAAVGSAEGYFTSREVSVMLSLLQVLDNPLQDIPLAAVMLSPLGGFSCDELTKLRLSHPGESLYTALEQQTRGEEDPLGAQCGDFLKLLRALREKAAVKRVRALIQYIYDTTDFVEVISGMSASSEREANLKLLLKYAGDYEAQRTGGGDLSGFVFYIGRLMEEKRDFEVAAPLSEEANAVRILSAHRSKGLEYPIVILANCSKRFNLMDLTGDTCLNPALGYGLRVINRETAQKYETVSSAAIRLREQEETVSEEMRLLYVAMTRARETLILNITEQNLSGKLQKLSVFLNEDEPLSPYASGRMRSWSDWLLAALIRHPAFSDIREQFSLDLAERWEPFSIELGFTEAAGEELEAVGERVCEPDEELIERLSENVCWKYPQEERTRIPAKLAVTDVVRKEEESNGLLCLTEPAFTKTDRFTPAQRGSIFHRALQFADYGLGRQDPQKELQRLTERGYLTAGEAQAIPFEKFASFFRSSLMERILKANRVRREYRFFDTVPASDTGFEGDDPILIQGIADCVIEEDGAGILLDFKTDALPPAILRERYAPQLRLYKKALHPLFPNGIKECILYSLQYEQAVLVD